MALNANVEVGFDIAGYPQFNQVLEDKCAAAGVGGKIKKVVLKLSPETALAIANNLQYASYAGEIVITAELKGLKY